MLMYIKRQRTTDTVVTLSLIPIHRPSTARSSSQVPRREYCRRPWPPPHYRGREDKTAYTLENTQLGATETWLKRTCVNIITIMIMIITIIIIIIIIISILITITITINITTRTVIIIHIIIILI